MDQNLSKNQQIKRLILLGDSARSVLQREVISLKQQVNLPQRLRGSLKSHPSRWMFGSVAAGLVASLLFRRRPGVTGKKRRGLFSVILGLALTAVRPLAELWLTDRIKNHLAGRTGIPAGSRFGSGQIRTPQTF